jgi:hypothetical protein
MIVEVVVIGARFDIDNDRTLFGGSYVGRLLNRFVRTINRAVTVMVAGADRDPANRRLIDRF